jgi:hypothetical protein
MTTPIIRIFRDDADPVLFHIQWTTDINGLECIAHSMVHQAVIADPAMRRIAARNVRRQLSGKICIHEFVVHGTVTV